jgi:hypothetical protein
VREGIDPIGAERGDGNGSGGERLVDARDVLFRRGQFDGDRLQPFDRDDAGGGVRVHDVAGINQPKAGLAGDRGSDRGIFELRGRTVDGGLIAVDLGKELRDQRALRIQLLARGERLAGEAGIPRQVELRIRQAGPVLRLFGDGLVECCLLRRCIDLRVHIAAAYHLALLEGDAVDGAVDPAADGHALVGFDRTEACQVDREGSGLDLGGRDGNGR